MMTGSEIDLLILVERLNRIAEWSEEKSLFRERF